MEILKDVKMFSNDQLKKIFERTKGHCHFCGDKVIFDKYGCKNINDLDGAWESDHVIQKAKGGNVKEENCLPACVRCNRLRWHYKGNELRELIFLGIIAKKEINKNSKVGEDILILKGKRENSNEKRRIKN